MECLNTLKNSIVNLDERVKEMEQFLEHGTEPPGCQEQLQKFRKETQSSLQNFTQQHNKIQNIQESSALRSDSAKNVADALEALVHTREAYLSKYGFKPAQHTVPSYPVFQQQPTQTTSAKRDESRTPQKVVSDRLIEKYTPAKTARVSHLSETDESRTPQKVVSDRLIEKYTPAKTARVSQQPETAGISCLVTRYLTTEPTLPSTQVPGSSAAGDQTYTVISPPSHHCSPPKRQKLDPSHQPDIESMLSRYIAPVKCEEQKPSVSAVETIDASTLIEKYMKQNTLGSGSERSEEKITEQENGATGATKQEFRKSVVEKYLSGSDQNAETKQRDLESTNSERKIPEVPDKYNSGVVECADVKCDSLPNTLDVPSLPSTNNDAKNQDFDRTTLSKYLNHQREDQLERSDREDKLCREADAQIKSGNTGNTDTYQKFTENIVKTNDILAKYKRKYTYNS